MGERQVFQPLTKEDKVTVVIYRVGIVLATMTVSVLASVVSFGSPDPVIADAVGYALYLSVGLSVFFIHLYIGKFKAFLKNLYYISLACLAVLLFIGKGSPSAAIAHNQLSLLLLLPLSGCLGFVTAKEAFCFKLIEGYLLALIMPIYLFLLALSALNANGAIAGLVLVAVLLVLFTVRKVFMPIAFDIGDKSAYQ